MPLVRCVSLAALIVPLVLSSPVLAWDGVDSNTGDSVEIEKGNLVRPGRDIQVFDWGSGEYRDVEVQSIQDIGGSVEVEVYDSESGEYRTFEMED